MGPSASGDHLARREPGLLDELAFGRHDQALARIDVPHQAGRQLDHPPAHGGAVLLDQQELVVVGDRDDDDDSLDVGAGDVLPPGVVQQRQVASAPQDAYACFLDRSEGLLVHDGSVAPILSAFCDGARPSVLVEIRRQKPS